MISTVTSEQMRQPKSVNLTCRGTTPSCHVTKVVWTGPNGNSIMAASGGVLDNKRVSSIVVSDDSFQIRHTCNLSYAGGSVARNYTG